VLNARFLLFVPAAVLVELVGLVVNPRSRALAFGLVSGVAVGTAGLGAEWWWTKAFLPLPQPVASSALPLMLGVGTVAALAGGLLSVWHVARLDEAETSDLDAARPPRTRVRWTGLVGMGVGVALMAAFAPPSAGSGQITGTIGLSRDCDGETRCLSTVTVRLEPADAADDAVWFYALAWQGRGPKADAVDPPVDPESGTPGIMRVALEPTGTPGEYVTAQALPMYGNWKTLLRLHLAPTTLRSLPLHAPDDPAISGERGRQVLVHDGDTVEVAAEKQFLQRETRDDVPGWLSTSGYGLVIASWLAMVLFFGWCYRYAALPAEAAARTDDPALV
jgi:hypothetical protein